MSAKVGVLYEFTLNIIIIIMILNISKSSYILIIEIIYI